MPLDGTYSGLQSSIATWLDRDDLDDVIPDFITLAEARLNENLRVAAMESTTALSLVSGGNAVLPSDFLDARMVLAMPAGTDPTVAQPVLDEATGLPVTDPDTGLIIANEISVSGAKVLNLADPAWAVDQYAYGLQAGNADVYTIIGPLLAIYPPRDAVIALYYYAKIPALSADNTTNWLLISRPQIYLYASLLESAPLLQDDQRTQLWKAALDQAIDDLVKADARRRWSNPTMRLTGPTP